MMGNSFNLIGSGGHSIVIIDCIEESNDMIGSIYDAYVERESQLGYPIKYLANNNLDKGNFIIAIGDNLVRSKVVDSLNVSFGIIIHPTSIISKYSVIGEGTVILANATINAKCQIGKHCIINTSASIDHECSIEDFVHISPNATLCGNVNVGTGTHIGAGAVILPGVNIGRYVTVGAGAVILKDVDDYSTVVGNPGRIIKTTK